MQQFSMIILGIIICVLGVLNMRGNIESIHYYNRSRVTEEDRPKYGRCMGLGSIFIGSSLIITGILKLLLENIPFEIIIILGCVLGIAFMLYGQFKYNKGIF